VPDLAVAKVPFWSAVITQTRGSITVLNNTVGYVDIQPPPGETWWVFIVLSWAKKEAGSYSITYYYDYDGTNARLHAFSAQYHYGIVFVPLYVARILTNSLYARLGFYNYTGTTYSDGCYGYSGFKLSRPLWSPRRVNDSAKPFKLKTDLPLPDPIKPLDKYKCLILGINPDKPDDYDLAIILEEDTPLAVDPNTGFPVERYSAYVSATALADLILKFKRGELDPVKAGYKKYLDKWKAEGIKLL